MVVTQRPDAKDLIHLPYGIIGKNPGKVSEKIGEPADKNNEKTAQKNGPVFHRRRLCTQDGKSACAFIQPLKAKIEEKQKPRRDKSG